MQATIDAAAARAGRRPEAIRRVYNVMGVVRHADDPAEQPFRQAAIDGPVERWVGELAGYYRDLDMDTFIFWPVVTDEERQVERFATEVVPAVKAALGAG